MKFWPSLLIISLLIVSACASQPTTTDDDVEPDSNVDESASNDETGDFIVNFRDRSIDLEPYVQGFPYSWFMPDLEQGYMLYFESTPDGQWLRHLSFEQDDDIDVTQGRLLHDIDWSTRSFRGGEHNTVLDRFVFIGDEKNDEFFNLYALDLEDGDVEAITDVDYVYGWGFSDDHRLLAYVVRHGETGPFNSCLHLRDLATGDDDLIWCDDGDDDGIDRLTWTSIDFADDDRAVIVRMQHDGNRNTTNLGRFDLNNPGPPQLLLERGVEHFRLGAIKDTFSDESFLYISAQEGIDNIYRYEFESADSQLLIDLDHEMVSADVIEAPNAPPLLMVLLSLPYGTIIELRDPEDGGLLWTETRDESISVRSNHDGKVMLSMSAVSTPFRMELAEIRVDDGITDIESTDDSAVAMTSRLFASLPEELANRIVHCDVERVEFPTFDEVDGEPRMLHAYLFEPRVQPPQHLRIARMTSFYGGRNSFRTGHQIMCEAGITTFSPAPRGSRGFGSEFAALNDGDLGGDDIVDLFYAARWLEANHNLRSYQIGVYGSSHGGYSSMRALTFPPETNGHDDAYDFGFGMSHAGFSDIIHFFEHSNIPDWVIQIAGDPATEADRLRDRSPLYHVERLQAPLLLTHGNHDRRVPVEGSRQFAEAAEEFGLPVVYEEFDGQGHGISGLDNRMRYYRAVFDFLETQVDPRLQDRANEN